MQDCKHRPRSCDDSVSRCESQAGWNFRKGQGQRLQVGLVLDQLLGPAVQKTDMRVDALDDLTVEIQYEAQYAVSRRMLGPEIEGEVAQGGFGHNGLASAAGSTPAADAGSCSIGLQFHRRRRSIRRPSRRWRR